MTVWARSERAKRSPRSRWHSRRSSAHVAPGRNEIQRSGLPQIRMYDSASRTIRPFEPLRPRRVGMYNCGPTVYDWQHIGNLYSYIVADVVRRTFEYLDRKSTRLNSSHITISYAVFCLKKKTHQNRVE